MDADLLYDAGDRERLVDEPPKRVEAPERTPFERDRARVVHAASSRRLAAKTQVMGPQADDFGRNRLTHTLEVAQVARDLFAGSTGAVRDAVLLNAGTALALVDAGEGGGHPRDEHELHEQVRRGMDRAAAALDSGDAAALVQRWVEASAALPLP